MVLRNSPGTAGKPQCVQYQEISSPVNRLDPTVDLTGAHLSHLFMDSLNQRVLKSITNTQMELATYCRQEFRLQYETDSQAFMDIIQQQDVALSQLKS